jgi:uncharacterized repeat protein (TIGR02543 family)
MLKTNKKRIMKKTILLLALVFCTGAGYAQVVDSGTCGTSLTWELTGTVPNLTLTITGTGAMNNYAYAGAPWYTHRSSITSAVIEAGVTSIGEWAFSECTALASVTIPEGVISIGTGAFGNCAALTSVTIPEGVISIGSDAFYGCSALTSVTIPEGVTSIGNSAFDWCNNLASVTIPGSVTSIGNYAFRYCSALMSVTILEGVTSIGTGAFSGCSALTSVTIPEGVISIGTSAFFSCPALTSVTIPGSVTSIGDYAFNWCDNLASVTMLGATPPALGISAFSSNSCTLTVPAGAETAYNATPWSTYFFPAVVLPGYPVTVSAGTGGSAGGGGLFAVGTSIILTAVPDAGYTFAGWSDGNTDAVRSYTVTAADVTLTATFAAIPPPSYPITVSAGTGGSVSGGGSFAAGTLIVLTAVPDDGYTFVGWSDGHTGAVRSYTVTAANVTLTATFAAIPPPVMPPPVTPPLRRVTLPHVPGVETDPGAGTYYIPSGESFVFTVVPAAAQRNMILNVTDGRTPSGVSYTRSDSGAWTVRIAGIRQDIVLGIDFSTANAAMDGARVWSSGGLLYIISPTAAEARIYGISGAQAKALTAAAGETVAVTLPAGAYIVVLGGKPYKVVVK